MLKTCGLIRTIFGLDTKSFGINCNYRSVYLREYPGEADFCDRNCTILNRPCKRPLFFEELLTLRPGKRFSAVIKFGIRVQNGKMKLEIV
jgi:hypothetical protein